MNATTLPYGFEPVLSPCFDASAVLGLGKVRVLDYHAIRHRRTTSLAQKRKRTMPSDSLSQSFAVGGIESLRPCLMGTRHMAVAGHYGAAHAAFVILEAGGNAVDAGVAAGIALSVLQSDLVNFAGVAPMLIYRAKERDVLTISGLGTWPRAVSPDLFQKHHGGRIPDGVLRTVVPAAPDAWITALENYGTMSFGDCAAAAIRFASRGFPMYGLMSDMIGMHAADYARWPSSAAPPSSTPSRGPAPPASAPTGPFVTASTGASSASPTNPPTPVCRKARPTTMHPSRTTTPGHALTSSAPMAGPTPRPPWPRRKGDQL